MNTVRRIYVEKRPDYAVKAVDLKSEMLNYLNINADNVRVLIRYDIEFHLMNISYKSPILKN